MLYTFSFGAFFMGLLMVIIGTVIFLYHQKIADAMGNGLSSYGRYKLGALIAIGVGFVVMLNLHTLVASLLLGQFFGL